LIYAFFLKHRGNATNHFEPPDWHSLSASVYPEAVQGVRPFEYFNAEGYRAFQMPKQQVALPVFAAKKVLTAFGLGETGCVPSSHKW
jgi:hypothetical protein